MSHGFEPLARSPLGRVARALIVAWLALTLLVFFGKTRLPGPPLSQSIQKLMRLLVRGAHAELGP